MKHVMFAWSTNLKSAGYDPATRVLEIQFRPKPGRAALIYRYADVPAEVHAGLMAAKSPGTYLADHIKGKFVHEKVEREKATEIDRGRNVSLNQIADPFREVS